MRVTFTDDRGHEESLTSAATAAVEAKANAQATGAPAISGTAQVNETLTAEVSGIADEDGLDNAVFSYQWLADGADISSATDSSYTLGHADEGKAISVAVSFTNDAGNDETLTSAASAAVEAAPLTPLTASVENVAASHDGENVFTFELRFSEEFGISYKTLREGPRLHGDRGNGQEGAAAGAGQQRGLANHGEPRLQRCGDDHPANHRGLRGAGRDLHGGRTAAVCRAGVDRQRSGPVTPLRTTDGKAAQGVVAPPFPLAVAAPLSQDRHGPWAPTSVRRHLPYRVELHRVEVEGSLMRRLAPRSVWTGIPAGPESPRRVHQVCSCLALVPGCGSPEDSRRRSRYCGGVLSRHLQPLPACCRPDFSELAENTQEYMRKWQDDCKVTPPIGVCSS